MKSPGNSVADLHGNAVYSFPVYTPSTEYFGEEEKMLMKRKQFVLFFASASVGYTDPASDIQQSPLRLLCVGKRATFSRDVYGDLHCRHNFFEETPPFGGVE
ncbi:unnamed protein product [Nesidiocoris tenuis]|uniref:Uncharacterized protein n=1 Tax=Nesidiocoris tenuis TaxID=355587 RepID=A0A6H5G5X3_9HEMI|nr:unnamed protein product [Nesidiocoris tenuis]CAA9997284.1 unnamed protein product [Nesidiocoris tenuis]